MKNLIITLVLMLSTVIAIILSDNKMEIQNITESKINGNSVFYITLKNDKEYGRHGGYIRKENGNYLQIGDSINTIYLKTVDDF